MFNCQGTMVKSLTERAYSVETATVPITRSR
nr:MAG TPA: hypothetical protein [Caudoviricetes sp.]